MKKIIDINTGKITEIELTADEIAQREKIGLEKEAKALAAQQAEAEKQAKLESAKAKLTALGLDEDEVNALLGID